MVTYAIVIGLVLFFSYMADNSKRLVSDNGTTSFVKTRDTKIFLFIVAATLIITAGCRYRVGTDYVNYVELYQEYSRMKWEDFSLFDEPMFPLLGNLSYKFFDSYHPMFFTASLITVGLMLYSTYKETTDFTFVSLLYIFAGGWSGSFNAVRQYLAVAIVFIGRHYIVQRKFFKFFLICCVAFLAHRSALFFILVYFLYTEKFTTVRLFAVIGVAVIISRSYESIFEIIGWFKEEEFVANDYALRSVNVLRILASCAPAIVALYFAFTRKLDKHQVFYTYVFVINAAIWIATADSAYLARLALYTNVFIPLGLSSILKSCDKRYYQFFRILTVILYFIFWLYEVLITKTLRDFEWIFSYL